MRGRDIFRRLVLLSLALLAGCGSPTPRAQSPTVAELALPATAAPPPPPIPSGTADRPTPTAEAPSPTIVHAGVGQATGEIAYLLEGDIWLLDLATGDTRQVTQRGDVETVTWTANGRGLVFGAGAEAADLYAIERDGSAAERLTEDVTREAFAAYSPGGALFFVRHTFDLERSSIDIVRQDPDGTRTIVHTEPGGLCGETGLRLLSETEFTLSLNCGRGRVVLLGDLETGATTNVEERLSAGCAYAAAPAPNARRLAVLASIECLPEQSSVITLIDLGTQPQPIARYTGAGISSLDWAPDGAWLVFSTSVGDAERDGLWLLEVEGQTGPERLTTAGNSPAWRPGTKE